MGSRIFSIELKCGCLVAEKETDGWEGMIPCYAEYGDMKKRKDREALELHDKCMKEYFEKKRCLKDE